MKFKYFHADWKTPIEEIKRQYRDLAMKFHPDMGGSVEAMQEVNAEFAWFKRHNYNIHENAEGGVYTDERQTTPDKTTEGFEEIIEAMLRMHVSVEVIGSWLWLSGDTKPHKEQIKAMGFRWSGGKSRWYMMPYSGYNKSYASGMTMGEIRAKYGSTLYEAKDNQLAV